MKFFLVTFLLFSLASSQTPPTNGTTNVDDPQPHTDFRKCVLEQCSVHNCSCGYILREKLLMYDDGKLGTCISREQFCSITIKCYAARFDDWFYWNHFCSPNTNSSTNNAFENTKFRHAFWIIGLFVVAGNAYVIVRSFIKKSCFKKAWPSASLQCNHVVILNIAVADLIMGIYLITLSLISAFNFGYKTFNLVEWVGSLGCSILGSLTVISSEASCLLMVTLTSFRVFHIYRPLSSMAASSWSWKACIFMSWLAAVFLGVFPILESASDYFVLMIAMKNVVGDTKIISKSAIEHLAFTVASLDHSNYSNHEFEPEIQYLHRYFPSYDYQNQFKYSLKSYHTYQNFSVQRDLIKFISNFYLSRYTPSGRFGFYSTSDTCLPIFFTYSTLMPGWEYAITLITLNLACFVFIAVGYILIYILSLKKPLNTVANTNDLQKREAKMQKRIARIIITDFACWGSICIMAFAVLGGWRPRYGIIHDAIGCFLLPINSALNPFLYSVSLSKLFKRLGCRPIKKCRK